MSRHKLSFAQQYCIRKAGLALQRSHALWPGCRIGIAVSGGVDSFVMLRVMLARQKILPFAIELLALHCNPGFAPESSAPLLAWLAKEGLASHLALTRHGLIAHSDENRGKSPCFVCAMHRRKWLFAMCEKYSLTHLAIGHNAQDLLTTFLMNFTRNGRAQTLPIAEKFFGGKLTMIRPLLLVQKKYIRQAARQWALPVWRNSCPSAGKTARADAEELVRDIQARISGAETSMLQALIRRELASYEDTDSEAGLSV